MVNDVPKWQTWLVEADGLITEIDAHVVSAPAAANETPKLSLDAMRLDRTGEPPSISDFETSWQTSARGLKHEILTFLDALPSDAPGKAGGFLDGPMPVAPETLAAWRKGLAAVRAWLLPSP